MGLFHCKIVKFSLKNATQMLTDEITAIGGVLDGCLA
jgi:hypothetical protein